MKDKQLDEFVKENGYLKGLAIFMKPDGHLDIMAVGTSLLERQGMSEILKSIISREINSSPFSNAKTS